MGLAFCLVLSYVAEKYFGIADITGAYVAGVILCNMRDSEYIAEKMDINSYMLFGPVFFASIGIKTNIREFTLDILLFSVVFVIVALLSKIIGCSLVGKIAGFNWPDSLKMGVGMMTRGEVALIVSQKGLAAGMIEPVYFMSVIMLIIVSSIATPMILKSLFTKYPSPKA
jgi:Kef-type K+ transport system membrane component KefB